MTMLRCPLVYESSIPVGKRKETSRRRLASVGLTDKLKWRRIALGRQKQRVAIARALVNSPTLFSPTNRRENLDSASGAQVMQILSDVDDSRENTVHSDRIAGELCRQ